MVHWQMRWLEYSCVLVHLVNVGHPNGMSIHPSRHTCGDQACKGRDHSLDATLIHQTKDKSSGSGFVFMNMDLFFCAN